MKSLRVRGKHKSRESGAFLLGRTEGNQRRDRGLLTLRRLGSRLLGVWYRKVRRTILQ